MSNALQVTFRRLPPSERLINLAAQRYEQMRRVLKGAGECVVSLETEEHVHRPVAHALVRVHEDGHARAEAAASHRNPHIALSLALADVQVQLGMFAAGRGLPAAHSPAPKGGGRARRPCFS